MTKIVIIFGVMLGVKLFIEHLLFEKQREARKQHYRQNVLTSGLWKRKRAVVLKRDGGRCKYCGGPATQVHHRKYAPVNIGREPIDWLESVCASCHAERHK